MSSRWIALLFAFFTLTGCMHWAPIASLDDAAGACRVRVVSDGRPPVVLERPTADRVAAIVHASRHARVEIRRINAWATALIATGSFLASAFTALVVLGAAAAGIAGG